MSERRAFKDYFDAALVRELASRLSHAESSFESAKFVRSACRGLEKLEMMARVGQIAEAMNTALPLPTARKMRALIGSLPAPAKSGDGITDYGYLLWPYGEFIGRYGLDDVEASFGAMIELTQRFTSEFAVRPFLAQDPNDIFTRLEALVAHESEHVRRFISEGTRTRLPWGKRVPALEAHLGRRLKILTALRSDPSPYVRRSVANHLGDILKDDPDAGLACLSVWIKEEDPQVQWVVRHAARNLLKQGDQRALSLFGQKPSKDLEVQIFKARPGRVALGGTAAFEVCLVNNGQKARKVRVDYRLYSPGAGVKENVKTFRLSDLQLKPGERFEKQFKYSFVARSTRAARPGAHRFVLVVNGVEAATIEVRVSGPKS